MEDSLRVDLAVQPKKQQLRMMSGERKKATQAKVQEPLDVVVLHEL